MIKSRISLLTLLLGLSLAPLAPADIFTLKDGTKLDGEIVSETEESYVIRYQVSKGIMDQKLVPKADVESIEKVSPADEAFEAIAALVPTPDRLSEADYTRMIEKQAKAFLEAFKSSEHTDRVEEILETLEKERAVVAAGGIKLDGTWISPTDRMANAYEVDARVVLAEATEAAEAGQFVSALRALDTMHSDFTASAVYPDAVDLTKRIFKVYGPRVEDDLGRVDTILEVREKELATLPPNQRKAAENEIERKDAAYRAVIERDKKEGVKWPILDIYHKEPMADTLRAIDNETRRLENLDLSTITPAGEVYRKAYTAAAAGRSTEARQLISQLQGLRVPERYITSLEDTLAEAEAPAPEPEPGTTGEDGAPEGGEAGDGTASEATTEDEESGEDESATSEPADPADPVADEEPPVAEEEGGIGLSTILFGVIAVVLVIAVVTVFAGGSKKKGK